jgi:hypothetical protein
MKDATARTPLSPSIRKPMTFAIMHLADLDPYPTTLQFFLRRVNPRFSTHWDGCARGLRSPPE